MIVRPYVIRVKVPSGVKLMPHKHPEEEAVHLGLHATWHIAMVPLQFVADTPSPTD